MDELNLLKKRNGGIIDDMEVYEYNDAKKSGYMCKAIRRFFPNPLDDKALICSYYRNDFLLQDIMRLEMKKAVMSHMPKLVARCRKYHGNPKMDVSDDEDIYIDAILNYFKDREDYGLFWVEGAWFLSEEDGGGIYDSNHISDIVDYLHE